jgi:peptide/nickel transport system permease protein
MSEWKVLRRHVVRNAFLPVITMLGMDIAVTLNAAVFVETIYGLPGLGKTAVQALQRQDLPTILGIVVWTTTVILVLNLVVDLVYTWLDPRVRATQVGSAVRAAARSTASGASAPPTTPEPAVQPTR